MSAADHAHGVVARCLTDADFLARALDPPAAGDPEAQAAADLLGAAELEHLHRFRGFITKVKHNALRRHLPATLGLMGALGMELAFFRSFSGDYMRARAAGPLATAPHMALFAAALERFLAARDTATAAPVAEVLDHETRLFDLREAPADSLCAPDMQWHGTLALARRRFDVLRICERLGARAFDPADLTPRSHLLAYWQGAGDGATSIFEVDATTAAILSALRVGEGPEATLAQLARAGLDSIGAADLHAAAAAVAARGFLTLRGDWTTGADA